jgi:iron complex outermembrane receptor protein
VGARVENYSGGETEFSPQVAFGFRISDRVRLKASASHAFRLPTYTDLYYSDPANLGNPNLKPERAWSYEGGMVWKVRDNVSTEMTLFTRRERDGIDYVRSTPAVPWQAANIDRLNFTGVEVLSTIARGQRQSFQFGYTGIYGAQESTGALDSKYVRDYPVHQATAGWLGSIYNLRLRGRIGVTDRYNHGAYPLAEVSAARRFGFVSPYLQITNVLNTGYEEIDGVRMPGRAYVAGLELHLSRETRTP